MMMHGVIGLKESTGGTNKGRGKDKEKQRLRREESKSSETKELHNNLQMSKRLAKIQLGLGGG